MCNSGPPSQLPADPSAIGTNRLIQAHELAVGEPVDLGCYRIDRDEIVTFATTWDPLPMHVDDAAARASHFGQIIASGMHTLAIMHRLAVLGAYQHWDVIAGRDVRDLSLLRPVLPGMELHGRLVVDQLEARSNGRWVVHHTNTLTVDGEIVLRMRQRSVVRAGRH